MDKTIIFYGAGAMSKVILEQCLPKNIIPVCLVDSDQHKHYNFWEAAGSRFEILPLDEALKRWPNADVWITTTPTWYADVYEILLSKRVPKERIRLPYPLRISLGTPKHCRNVGHLLVLDGLGVKNCCAENYSNLTSTGNFMKDIEMYYEFNESLRNSLNEGKLTRCADCNMLCDGPSEEPLSIKTINLGTGLPGGDRCNAKCCYCTYGETLGASDREDNVLDIFRQIAEQLDVDVLNYAVGEISISPYRDEMLRIWKEKGWKGNIDTNAFVYCDGISALLRGGLVSLLISLDAGTAETFAQIKGVDCFGKALENIEKYSDAGEVVLKYIVLEGINDNAADVDGFVAIAKKIGADVVISRDRRVSHMAMTENEYATIARLVNQCEAVGLRYSLRVVLECLRPLQGNTVTADGFPILTA